MIYLEQTQYMYLQYNSIPLTHLTFIVIVFKSSYVDTMLDIPVHAYLFTLMLSLLSVQCTITVLY